MSFLNKAFLRIFAICKFITNYKDERLLYKGLSSSSSSITTALLREGYYVYPDRLPSDIVDQLLQEFDQLKSRKDYKYEGQLNRRIFSSRAFLSVTLEQLAVPVKADLSDLLAKPNVELTYFQDSIPESFLKNVPGGSFHVDDNKANYKYFIYLTDVSASNGPFSVVSGSGSWKLNGSFLRGLLWESTKLRIFLYSFGLHYSNLLGTDHMFTGLKGTHFIVDTTCLHRDNVVIKDKRSVAVVSFNAAS